MHENMKDDAPHIVVSAGVGESAVVARQALKGLLRCANSESAANKSKKGMKLQPAGHSTPSGEGKMRWLDAHSGRQHLLFDAEHVAALQWSNDGAKRALPTYTLNGAGRGMSSRPSLSQHASKL